MTTATTATSNGIDTHFTTHYGKKRIVELLGNPTPVERGKTWRNKEHILFHLLSFYFGVRERQDRQERKKAIAFSYLI